MEYRKTILRPLAWILAMTLCLPWLAGCGKQEPEVQETEATTLGIDVARYQGTIDWQQVSQS